MYTISTTTGTIYDSQPYGTDNLPYMGTGTSSGTISIPPAETDNLPYMGTGTSSGTISISWPPAETEMQGDEELAKKMLHDPDFDVGEVLLEMVKEWIKKKRYLLKDHPIAKKYL